MHALHCLSRAYVLGVERRSGSVVVEDGRPVLLRAYSYRQRQAGHGRAEVRRQDGVSGRIPLKLTRLHRPA